MIYQIRYTTRGDDRQQYIRGNGGRYLTNQEMQDKLNDRQFMANIDSIHIDEYEQDNNANGRIVPLRDDGEPILTGKFASSAENKAPEDVNGFLQDLYQRHNPNIVDRIRAYVGQNLVQNNETWWDLILGPVSQNSLDYIIEATGDIGEFGFNMLRLLSHDMNRNAGHINTNIDNLPALIINHFNGNVNMANNNIPLIQVQPQNPNGEPIGGRRRMRRKTHKKRAHKRKSMRNRRRRA